MKKQAWLVRPKPHGKDRWREFLSDSLVAVGWPGLGDLTGFGEGELRKLIAEKYGSDPSALATLKMMVYRMEIGDYIVVPYEGIVRFGRITSTYRYDKRKDNEEDGYPHQRSVEWLELAIPREDLPQELQKSSRVVRVSSELTQHFDIINNIINNNGVYKYESRKPAVDHKEVSEQLYQQAMGVLSRDLESKDPDVRLRAAQIIIESMGKKRQILDE